MLSAYIGVMGVDHAEVDEAKNNYQRDWNLYIKEFYKSHGKMVRKMVYYNKFCTYKSFKSFSWWFLIYPSHA